MRSRGRHARRLRAIAASRRARDGRRRGSRRTWERRTRYSGVIVGARARPRTRPRSRRRGSGRAPRSSRHRRRAVPTPRSSPRTKSELPYRVAASWWPSVSSMLRRPFVSAVTVSTTLASAAPGESPASSRSRVECEQHLGVGVAFDAGEALRAQLRAQLIVDTLAEPAHRAVEREEPRPGDEGRVAARVDGGPRRRETGRAEERATLDGPGLVGERMRRPRSA